jgi:hypothetical protein
MIENDMKAVYVCLGDIVNRDEWWLRVTPNSWEKAKENNCSV